MAGLLAKKRDCLLGLDCGAHHRASGAIDAARQINGDDRCSLCVHGLDHRLRQAADRAIQAGAKQRVDDDVSARELARLGLDPAGLPGYDSQAAGHLQVAAAVAGRLADVGVASEPAALAYGLNVIPLAEERFDLVLPAKHAASREVQGLLRVLTSPWLLAQLASLPGYGAARCGERSS